MYNSNGGGSTNILVTEISTVSEQHQFEVPSISELFAVNKGFELVAGGSGRQVDFSRKPSSPPERWRTKKFSDFVGSTCLPTNWTVEGKIAKTGGNQSSLSLYSLIEGYEVSVLDINATVASLSNTVDNTRVAVSGPVSYTHLTLPTTPYV